MDTGQTPQTYAPGDLDAVLDRLAFHPATPETVPLFERQRAAAQEFARVVAECAPASPERTLAFRAIEDALMRANQAVAVNLAPRE